MRSPTAKTTRIMTSLKRRVDRISVNQVRLRVNRVLGDIDRAAQKFPSYLADQVVGVRTIPSGPGWDDVRWAPLKESTIDRKIRRQVKLGLAARQGDEFFLDTGDLKARLGSFSTGRAFGRSMVRVGTKKITNRSAAGWSGVSFEGRRTTTISIIPFRRVTDDLFPGNSRKTLQLMRSVLDQKGLAKLKNPKGKYRALIEPALLHFFETDLRKAVDRSIRQRGL